MTRSTIVESGVRESVAQHVVAGFLQRFPRAPTVAAIDNQLPRRADAPSAKQRTTGEVGGDKSSKSVH
jgi:hypothetical protein